MNHQKKKYHTAFFACILLGVGLSGVLAACSPASPTAKPGTAALTGPTQAADTATPAPQPTATDVPATSTRSPSPTATPPLSPVVIQALKDAFNCLTNNMVHAAYLPLTRFCPGYWDSTPANMYQLDGVTLREKLEPYLSPLDNLRWRFASITDVQKDEALSTSVNPVYTAKLSAILTGDVTLKCPSGTPAPYQTTVAIPLTGEARLSVLNYKNQAQETIQIESWKIQGDPLKDYCATLH